MKKMLGMGNEGGSAVYRLDKVSMSGDDGKFTITDLTTERAKGVKPTVTALGEKVEGVILKMRWILEFWDQPNTTFYSSTEYDDKWKDTVTVYPVKDKGSVETMKAKYKLKTLRVIYFYIPSQKKVVRLMVKASALSGKDKNVNGELGLFEYINDFASDESLPCEYVTECTGVFRAGTNQDGSANKRKDHYAMTFARGRVLTESEFAKIQTLMIEVNEKTNTPAAEVPEEPQEVDESQAIDDAFDAAFPDKETNVEEPAF